MPPCSSIYKRSATYNQATSSERYCNRILLLYGVLTSIQCLDAQRIHNLVTYLQELHSLGVANSDHTTLLLNTYTKLKDAARLDNFIKTESKRGSSGGTAEGGTDELPFDLDTAIRVCRQAGYFEHAAYLAKRWSRHEDYLRIQIEDTGNFTDALAYLRHLGPEAVSLAPYSEASVNRGVFQTENNLARYGRAMVAALPDETTQLLIEICTGTDPLVSEPDTLAAPSKHTGGGSYLSYLALRGPAAASTSAPAPASPITATDPPVSSGASIRTARPTERAPRREATLEGSRGPSPPSTLIVQPAPRPVRRPSPRLYFANFVGHREHLLVFLEAVALRRWGQSLDGPKDSASAAGPGSDVNASVEDAAEAADQQAVWNTLLELYLTLASAAGEGARADALREKALQLLRAAERLPYDPMHALILCATRTFTPGLVLLWERLGMHEDVLRFWMEQDRRGVAGAGTEVMRCLAAYGEGAPGLYKLALRFFTSAPELVARHSLDLAEVLRVVEEREILPPLGVVQVLSRNEVASVGLVKEWLLARIRTAREEVQTVRFVLLRATSADTRFLFCFVLWACVCVGRTVDCVVSARDGHETQASRGTLRSRPTTPVSCPTVLAVRWPTGPSQRPLHVQTQLPPEVSNTPFSPFA